MVGYVIESEDARYAVIDDAFACKKDTESKILNRNLYIMRKLCAFCGYRFFKIGTKTRNDNYSKLFVYSSNPFDAAIYIAKTLNGELDGKVCIVDGIHIETTFLSHKMLMKMERELLINPVVYSKPYDTETPNSNGGIENEISFCNELNQFSALKKADCFDFVLKDSSKEWTVKDVTKFIHVGDQSYGNTDIVLATKQGLKFNLSLKTRDFHEWIGGNNCAMKNEECRQLAISSKDCGCLVRTSMPNNPAHWNAAFLNPNVKNKILMHPSRQTKEYAIFGLDDSKKANAVIIDNFYQGFSSNRVVWLDKCGNGNPRMEVNVYKLILDVADVDGTEFEPIIAIHAKHNGSMNFIDEANKECTYKGICVSIKQMRWATGGKGKMSLPDKAVVMESFIGVRPAA